MSASIKNEPEMNRREFVKTAAAGAAGLALMGLPTGKSEAVQKYPHWGEAVVIRDEGPLKGQDHFKVVQEMLEEAIKALTNGGMAIANSFLQNRRNCGHQSKCPDSEDCDSAQGDSRDHLWTGGNGNSQG